MNHIFYCSLLAAWLCLGLTGCKQAGDQASAQPNDTITMKLNDFAVFRLTTDLDVLTEKEKEMIPLFIEAAAIMDDIFWHEAYGDKQVLLEKLDSDAARKLAMIQYGPWERLNNNRPFLPGYGPKPPGANFYPSDMTKEEFDSLEDQDKTGQYSLIRRDDSGNLVVIPYHVAFSEQVENASVLLRKAAALAEDAGLKRYLELRADALLSDDYLLSDMAWMDMKDNRIDFIVGPIENYEDQLYGYKSAHEAYLLIKDMQWSDRLLKYTALLPKLQEQLPVGPEYKAETPGASSDLGAYDAIYYAGDCNAGSKTIAINLPNDERVQQAKGSRRLQLKNAMQAKFDKILVPIAGELMSEETVQHVTFDAFFTNTMFHEIAHGLGCNLTINGRGTVSNALKEHYTTLEEGKADILGLFLIKRLHEMGEIDIDLTDAYTTFVAGIFRSIRFGTSSAHGKANLIRYNYFRERRAFEVHEDGRISIDIDTMQDAIDSLTSLILTIQGDGDYDRAASMIQTYGIMDDQLKASLDRIEQKDIPVDIVFEQGIEALGL